MKDRKNSSRILVVDDHPLFREGLVRVLNQEKDLEVCGEAADGSEALRRLTEGKPDLAIVDISLDGTNGIELTKQLRDRRPDLRILMLSMHDEGVYADRALRAGANGYVMKRERGSVLLEAVRRVLAGHAHFSEEVNDRVLQTLARSGGDSKASSVDGLSDREFEVFQLIGDGFGTRQIADRLNLSIKTVETYREHIKVKLHLPD